MAQVDSSGKNSVSADFWKKNKLGVFSHTKSKKWHVMIISVGHMQ